MRTIGQSELSDCTTVTRFSKNKDEESVRKCLLPLISGEFTPVSTAQQQKSALFGSCHSVWPLVQL